MRTLLRFAGAFAILLLSSQAMAQYLAPIRYNEGPGVKLSDSLVFHPGVALEGRYDSNALYQESDVNPAGFLRVIGHLDLATLPPQRLTDGNGSLAPQKVEFRLKTAVAFREYFSDVEAVKQQRAVEVDAGLLLRLFPRGVFSFTLQDDFARTVQARGQEGPDTFTRDTNRVAALFRLAPGGGRLTFDLGYALTFDIFEDSNLAGANKLYHELKFISKYKILPKTAVALEVIQNFINYYNPDGWNVGYQNNDSMPFRVYAGLLGLITPRISTVLKLGYGNGFYEQGASYNMILATAELGFQIGPYAKLRAGYSHDFQDSLFANYFSEELIYLAYDHFVLNRVLLHLRGDYRYRNYDALPESVASDELTQNVVTLSVGADYQIQEWLYVGAGYDLQLQDVIEGPQALNSYFANSFTKHQVFGKVGVTY